jgi:RNA polymerase sigma-70 factor, ECF subfamily
MSVSFAVIHLATRIDLAESRDGRAGAGAMDLDAVYKTEIRRLIGLASVLTGSRAAGEDLAHDAFLQVLRRVEREPDYLRSPAWPLLRTVLVRLAVQRRRAIARETRRLAQFWKPPENEVWDPDVALIDWRAALHALPPRMRACAVLFYGEDMSINDIAHELRCSPRTVEHHLHSARGKLTAAIDVVRREEGAL